MGASTKRPELVLWIASAMERDEVGSMVEQSMNRRSSPEGVGGSGLGRMLPKAEVTAFGSRRHVMRMSCSDWY